jgi:hypothetical protein
MIGEGSFMKIAFLLFGYFQMISENKGNYQWVGLAAPEFNPGKGN